MTFSTAPVIVGEQNFVLISSIVEDVHINQ